MDEFRQGYLVISLYVSMEIVLVKTLKKSLWCYGRGYLGGFSGLIPKGIFKRIPEEICERSSGDISREIVIEIFQDLPDDTTGPLSELIPKLRLLS